ncbi:MAG: 3-deoxy-D-manno-octulosonic acid transferase [Alistipes sp.]|nr:3-deoxy-D-manno-octulosonic acid transferase [Alistipes sp.]
MFLYNFCVAVYARLIALASLWNNKARLWTAGRKGIFERMAAAISPSDRIVWIHVASLGEFEQGRPVMERIKADYPQYKILLTFFSPSGYEVRKNYKGADYIFYMPIDTPRNVRRFLDLAHPEIAIFVKYEFWINYLTQLKRRNVRTFVISAIFRPNSIFFRRYGYLWRQALDSFEQIFVQNEESRRLLHDIGFDNVVVAGDTRFDRVAAIAEGVKRICLIERFKGDSHLFVAGSTWRPDEEILQPLINNNPEIKFVIVPHEMDECRINRIIAETTGGAVRYTQCDDSTPLDNVQVLVLDTVGMLSSVYRYASWAYIGGGFGAGIHNTLEAAIFALPIAFGPNYSKFKEARDMVALGAAAKVETVTDLEAWFAPLRDNTELRARVSSTAKDYTLKNIGATSLIMKIAFEH